MKLAQRGRWKDSHGLSDHPLYGVWTMMLHRCEKPDNPRFAHYGGRGIRVCDRWHDVRMFVEDIEREIGPRPAGYTLDRIDTDDNYEPGKVRWSTPSRQNRNRRASAGRIKGVSRLKGDHYHDGKPTPPWVARVHLGRFESEEEAGEIYRRAVEVLEREGLLR